MKLRADQLGTHLRDSLLPIYVISGDEPLQVAEAADAIRAAARKRGFTEREVMHAESGFDWNGLAASAQSLSLFAERKIIDLRVSGAKVGDAGGKALALYAESPPEDNLLLLTMGKLERQPAKWLNALERAGALIQIWPIDHAQLPNWIGQRMRARGLQPSREAVQLVADRVEGNLLAASQEIDKLALLYGAGAIDADQVAAAVADSARYSGFELLEAALAGDAARAVRILDGLRAEGVEPLALLGLVMWEVRNLGNIARDATGGIDAALARHGVWEKRKAMTRAALQRHPGARRWQRFLLLGARIDRQVKGQEPGNPWDELLHLTLLISGVRAV